MNVRDDQKKLAKQIVISEAWQALMRYAELEVSRKVARGLSATNGVQPSVIEEILSDRSYVENIRHFIRHLAASAGQNLEPDDFNFSFGKAVDVDNANRHNPS